MGKRKKKSASEASLEVVWGCERVAEPGDIPSDAGDPLSSN